MATEGFLERYRRFFRQRKETQGPEFHDPPPRSIPPPTVTFTERLHWWSVDRWKRRMKIRRERDHRVQEILDLRQQPPPPR